MYIREIRFFGQIQAVGKILLALGGIPHDYIRGDCRKRKIFAYKFAFLQKFGAGVVPIHTFKHFIRPRLQGQVEMLGKVL